jgi:energy-coupling factor transporter ATP-binding protein EcfA2
MGVGVLSELLMRFWPGSCCSYNKSLIHEGLVAVGMAEGDFVWPKTPSIYQEFMGKCAVILRKMEEMNLPRKPIPGNEEAPDYITVNEFLWFASDNKDLIKEKVMSKQWKSVNSKDKVKNGTRKLSEALSGNDMLKRLVAALRTKPFAILAGHSGTGKSQLVRRLAYMTCNNDLLIKEGEGKTAPGNYCMVQVKPNWHDSTDLLGYYSEMGERHFVNTPFVEFICKAYAYPDTPFFVCLDEMNLAPVEQYFAEYLSAIESMENKGGVWLTDPLVEVDKTGEKDASGKEKVDVEIVDQIMKGAASKEAADWIQAHGLTIPKNLFVVGTVNMDETTCQFSRKVLDRAMTLLMNDVKFSDMAASKKPSDEELLDEAGLDFFLEGEERGTVGAAESALLDGINEPLANTPFVVAYRFANEYALYEAALAKLDGVDLAAANDEEKKKFAMKALDHVVMMKLLPRIHGERGTVRVLFEGGKRGDKNVPGLESKLPSGGLSVDMMKKILERRDEYLTFWP